ncbi:MAG: nucleoside-diphosphate kinase [Chloroflexi bacterium]|nr:nucleoside-diphosphate kinase [Chloroflexota bacterium]MCI0803864.1 nucleoside-diphosphate kinase [Chloroflexota bacterium]MCI0836983.1 nucleoside-diphosphate kinase [Chloroflexota bacterium]MCI0851502.1 nucleoside-diphosphate kinase [Chloroflexota bacterium]MCI0874041.1 nucleoside-diphosphate kinase [Chloroflexota bacterium]
MSTERTLVLVKPDGVQRGLTGEIVGRLERTGLQIIGMKLMMISEDLASRHYAEHTEKPFYRGLVSFITSSPVVALALEGPSAISTIRKVMGVTDPADAAPGSIRGDLGIDMGRNLIHGSANSEDAAREVTLFFDDSELISYDRATQPWIVE